MDGLRHLRLARLKPLSKQSHELTILPERAHRLYLTKYLKYHQPSGDNTHGGASCYCIVCCALRHFLVLWNSSVDFKSIRYSHTQFNYVYTSQERNPSRFSMKATAQICKTVSCTFPFPEVELVTVQLLSPLFAAFCLSNPIRQSTRIVSI
jgi:hypothetical protein